MTTTTLGWSHSLAPLALLASAILEVNGERQERQALG